MLTPGTVFAGRYEILRTISAGGMGTVYEAMHRETRRRRALKVMLPNMLKDADLRRRFALEAQVTADVESEHIVETFDAGVDAESGSPFLVMELLRGEDLGARLGRLVRLAPREVAGLLGQAADALDKTHAAGILHRDLKPENLFVVPRDGFLKLKLLDFGIAKVVRQTEVGKATRSMGTPLYMSPEQFDGEAALGPGVDRYALAHIAYTLLIGEPYWTEEARELANALALMKRVCRGATEAATARAARAGVVLPASFDGWFAQATARDPAERFPTAAATVEALADALGVRAAMDEPVAGSVPLGEETGRRTVVTPGGSTSSRDVIGQKTTLAEPEREPSGAARTTKPTSPGSPPAPRARYAAVALLAAVTVGATYLLLRHDGPAPPPGRGSASPAIAAPPTVPSARASEEPAVRPVEPQGPTGVATTSPSAPISASVVQPRAPGQRPPGPRPPTPPPVASPPPAAPTGGAPDEPWRTR